MKYGITVVVYDHAGEYFFFVVRKASGEWELPGMLLDHAAKPEPQQEVPVLQQVLDTYLSQYKIAHRFEHEIDDGVIAVFVGESSMNSPVTLPETHDNYLWGKAESVEGKLTSEEDRAIFKKVNQVLNA